MRRLALVTLVVAAPAQAGVKDDFAGASVIYAKGTSLWKADPQGKEEPVEVVALPGNASDVTMIRANPQATDLLIEAAGVWYRATLGDGVVQTEPLDCAAGPARFTAEGTMIVCAADGGKTRLISIKTGRETTPDVPPDGARVVKVDGVRRLIWADGDGVWSAKLRDLSDKQELAPDPPVRGFLAAPDGSRGVAIYPGHVYEKKQKVDADVLSGFALDGTAAPRMLFRDGEVLDWSWDSTWILLQDGDNACIARATGGEYKCWDGYRALSIAPDGRYGLVRGADSGKLFRVRIEGQYTDKPSLVETEDDGAAVWLQAVP